MLIITLYSPHEGEIVILGTVVAEGAMEGETEMEGR